MNKFEKRRAAPRLANPINMRLRYEALMEREFFKQNPLVRGYDTDMRTGAVSPQVIATQRLDGTLTGALPRHVEERLHAMGQHVLRTRKMLDDFERELEAREEALEKAQLRLAAPSE